MPQYIRKTQTLKARAATHSKVVSGDITLEEGWEQIKGMCPLFTGQPYGEAHDKFTDSFLKVIGQAPAFKNAKQADKDVLKQVNEDYVSYRYIQNTSYDEDKKIYSCDIVEYFKDQASVDLANAALDATETYGKKLPAEQEPTYKTVDFHRPYPS